MNSFKVKELYVQKITQRLFLLLSNLKFAIVILLIIAGFSILGTVIEQNQSLDFYKENYPKNKSIFGFINWEIIKFFVLDNLYRSWWYLSLIVVLGFSLISCSFTQQLPSLKISKHWQIFKRKKQLKNIDLKIKLDLEDFSKIIYHLNINKYNIFQQENYLYSYKGIIGRVAPIFVHISIIQIFIGALIGAFFGYSGQEIIPKTETFHLQNVINAGSFSKIPLNISLRVNNFWIDYTKINSNDIKQYYTDLSLINNFGIEVKRKIISVNNPLHYKDITVYQSDWDILGVRATLDKKTTIQYQSKKIRTANGNRWLTKLKTKDAFINNLLIKDLTGDLSIYNKDGDFLKNIKGGDIFVVKNNEFTFDDFLVATGIDIKSDPGIPFVYIGFVFLMVSTLLSFISYSRIWVLRIKKNIFLAGTSNRAKLSFERHFLNQVNDITAK